MTIHEKTKRLALIKRRYKKLIGLLANEHRSAGVDEANEMAVDHQLDALPDGN